MATRGSYGSPIEGSSTLVSETLEDGRERMTRFVVSHERVLLGPGDFFASRGSAENKRMADGEFDKDTIQGSFYSSL